MVQGDDQTIKLVLKEDGVYLSINRSIRRESRLDVLNIIEKNKVKDIDFEAVNNIFKSSGSFIEVKISSNTDILCKPEEIKLYVSKDKMTAYVQFIAPINSDKLVTFDDLMKSINSFGILYGVDEEKIEEYYLNREFGREYIVASGLLPVNGIDGYLDFKFDTSKKTYKPKELDDGNVDFKELNLFEVTCANAILIEAISPIDGQEGMSVLGKKLSYKKGKNPPAFPRGLNTRISDDKRYLIAEESGQIVYNKGGSDNRVNVLPVMEIEENVDNSVGNIDFIGSVIVKGNVLSGFEIRAGGNIEVYGVLEGAYIEAGRDIYLFNGVQGREKAVVKSMGEVNAKYLSRCTVYSEGDIHCDCILHSNIFCNSSVIAIGKKGLIIGGKAIVKKRVEAMNIGSVMSTSTEFEIGYDYNDSKNYKSLVDELDKTMNNYFKLKESIDNLNDSKNKKQSVADRHGLMLRKQSTISLYKEKMKIIQLDLENYLIDFSNEHCEIIVHDSANNGVKVLIGNALHFVSHTIKGCRIVNVNNEIAIIPLENIEGISEITG